MKKILSFLQLPFSRRQRMAMENRSWASLDWFKSRFPTAEEEASELWNQLRSIAVIDDFRPDPDDDLLYIFGVVDEDLDELIVGSLNRLGYRTPLPEEIEGMAPVKTVGDAVLFLARWRS